MSTGNHIKHYSALDIEKYQKGELSKGERHAMEKAALDDPFLADALEGYASTGTDIEKDLADLKHRMALRLGQGKLVPLASVNKKQYSWMRVAAMLVILAGGAIIASQFLFNKKQADIAVNEKQNLPATDSSASVAAPSNQNVILRDSVQPGSSDIEKTTSAQAGGTATAPRKNEETVTNVSDQDMPTARYERDSRKDNEVNNVQTQPTVAEEKAKTEAKEKQLYNKQQADRELAAKRAAANEPQVINQGVVSRSRINNTNIFRGRVTDNSNRGLPFANVTSLRDNVGTYTDASGYFTLTAPDSVINVQVRSLGFDNNYAQLRNTSPTNQVVMAEDDKKLAEVVVNSRKANSTQQQSMEKPKAVEPMPVDGWDKYDLYLANNLNKPADYNSNEGGQKQVELSFEINKRGEPVDVKVEKSVCKSCDLEAIRLVKEGPKWTRPSKKARAKVIIIF